MNILFTCAGRRTYLLKYFKEQLCNDGKVIGADMQLSAPALLQRILRSRFLLFMMRITLTVFSISVSETMWML